MIYGLIGEHLTHSFSREIHAKIAPYQYELLELEREALAPFLKKRDFIAINVTIPYKEVVIPHLDVLDEAAKAIGTVNTVVNKNGKLYGYNTDFFGMCELLKKNNVQIKGKKVLILGTGGTSQTARAVVSHLGAESLVVVSRKKCEGCVSYDEAYANHADAQVIINTTPCGMYPYADGTDKISCRPIDVSAFKNLVAYIDAVYNPLRTDCVLDAMKNGVCAEGGLYMLVSQATAAYEFFTDSKLEVEQNMQIYKQVMCEKENIVLTGMPGSGKTTVAKVLSKKLQREVYDTDALIEEKAKMPISDIFSKYGEKYFRDLESEVIAEVSQKSGVIVSTGGGAVLREQNVHRLKRNGRIYFLDRPLEDIIPTSDRPLSLDREALTKRYNERYSVYCSSCDCRITDFDSINETAEAVMGDFYK